MNPNRQRRPCAPKTKGVRVSGMLGLFARREVPPLDHHSALIVVQ